jgi:UDP-N-acetylglucosamine 1-carboxyvinyltransferase
MSREMISIRGGMPLHGDVTIGGAKNAALPMMAACLLTDDVCTLENVPNLADVETMAELLRYLGATVDIDPPSHRATICAKNIARNDAPTYLVEKMRASFLVTSALLARTGEIAAAVPGGCKLGSRPVDVDVRGFQQLGATVTQERDGYRATASRLAGTDLYLDYPSHTGTENLMMAATLAEGETTITNASREPEIIALGDFLNRMGAHVRGTGTSTIRIRGKRQLFGGHGVVVPDRLEAGTFAAAAAITRGDVILRAGVIAEFDPDSMTPVTQKLREAGTSVQFLDAQTMRVSGGKFLHAVDIQALHFPGFPTDLQAVFATLMTQAQGVSAVYERVFDDRLRYVGELHKLGADIEVLSNTKAFVRGPTRLHAAPVTALDLRCAAALVLAGLAADGTTTIRAAHHLRRGYERMIEKMVGIGAYATYEITDAAVAAAD